jgi:TrpR-related protein YerC/YecD
VKHRHKSQDEELRAEYALYQAVLSLRSAQECAAFFKDLATPAELEALSDRWRVVGLLKQELPYRVIAERTGVSVTTIGRVARCLADTSGGYELAWQRLNAAGRKQKEG